MALTGDYRPDGSQILEQDLEPDEEVSDDQLRRMGISVPVETSVNIVPVDPTWTQESISQFVTSNVGVQPLSVQDALADVPELQIANQQGGDTVFRFGSTGAEIRNPPYTDILNMNNVTINNLDVLGDTYLMGATRVTGDMQVTGNLEINGMSVQSQFAYYDGKILELEEKIRRLEENNG